MSLQKSSDSHCTGLLKIGVEIGGLSEGPRMSGKIDSQVIVISTLIV